MTHDSTPDQMTLLRAGPGEQIWEIVSRRLTRGVRSVTPATPWSADTVEGIPLADTPDPLRTAIAVDASLGDAPWIGAPADLAIRAVRVDRNPVVVVVEASRAWERWVTWGTVDGADDVELVLIDLELAGLRWADAVVAISESGVRFSESLGVEAQLLAGDVGIPPGTIEADRIVVYDPPSRRSRWPLVARALRQILRDDREASVWLPPGSPDDEVWRGTTLDAFAPLLDGLRNRLVRRRPRRPGAVLVSDPLRPLDDRLRRWAEQGVGIIVPADGVIAAEWAAVATWETVDDLVAVLSGSAPPLPAPASLSHAPWWPIRSPGEPGRARRVSVGIPVFEDVRFLEAAVRSALGQTEAVHEVLLYDDGSTSSEVEVALAGAKELDSKIRVLSGPNRGVCVARNRMIEAMTGDAFVLLDADDELHPDFVAECAAALRARPDLDAVATWTEFFGAYQAVEAKLPFDERVGRRENPIVSTAALVDLRVAERSVRFTPDLADIYCEDWDYWSQIVASGGRMGLVPRPLVRHRVHRSSGGYRRTEQALRIGRARATERLAGPSSD